MKAEDTQATFAATFVDELARAEVRDAVIAPGSRSTPLAVALAREPRLRLHVVLDERSAGFLAAGLAMSTGRPAVVLTTSGTAAAELHAAVVETHQAGVPMLVCTADRPPDLHGVGASQTIDQEGLYARAVRWAATVDPLAWPPASWRSLVSRAVAEAVDGPRGPGPVHLNLPFREPLLGQSGALPPGRRGTLPWHERVAPPASPGDELVEALAVAGQRGVIIAGVGAGGRGSPDSVLAAALHLRWPVLADPRSGCRVPGPVTVAAADALLRVGEFAERHRPDLILRLGAPWSSRVLSGWLAGQGDASHVVVDPHGTWSDPERAAGQILTCDPGALCQALAATLPPGEGRPAEGWLAAWREAEAHAQAAIDDVLAGHPEPTEPGVARSLCRVLPDGSTIVASASMPVRQVEWFAAPRRGLRVLSNRGASGIDGVTSTAAGVALGERAQEPVVALIGDLALLHDPGGLLAARWTQAHLTLVVVDNGGGGIFSFLPQATGLGRDEFERLFGTPHGLDLGRVLAGYGVENVKVDRAADVAPAVLEATGRPGLQAVIVPTDRLANVAVHAEIHAAVAAAVRGGRPPPAGPAA